MAAGLSGWQMVPLVRIPVPEARPRVLRRPVIEAQEGCPGTRSRSRAGQYGSRAHLGNVGSIVGGELNEDFRTGNPEMVRPPRHTDRPVSRSTGVRRLELHRGELRPKDLLLR